MNFVDWSWWVDGALWCHTQKIYSNRFKKSKCWFDSSLGMSQRVFPADVLESRWKTQLLSFYFATSLCGAVLVLVYLRSTSQVMLSRCCCFSVALFTNKLCVQMLYLRLKTTCWLFPSTTHRPSWSSIKLVNLKHVRDARSGFKLQGDVMQFLPTSVIVDYYTSW